MRFAQICCVWGIEFFEVSAMKRPRDLIAAISGKLALPASATAQLPCTVTEGFHTVSVDLQKGLLHYSESEIVAAVPLGAVAVLGEHLSIALMKQGRIIIHGEIRGIEFRREERHV